MNKKTLLIIIFALSLTTNIYLLSSRWLLSGLLAYLKAENVRYFRDGATEMRDAIYKEVLEEREITIGNSNGDQVNLIILEELEK